MFKFQKVLVGHTTQDTAYVVEDYPYGFKLRCKIRYWLEFSVKHGFRLCSQTTNPKKSYEHWNAPKKSVYSMLGVMGLNDEGHVTWDGISPYDLTKIEAFGALHAEHFDVNQRKVFEDMRRVAAVYAKREAERAKAGT
jgi:hypothetical protein